MLSAFGFTGSRRHGQDAHHLIQDPGLCAGQRFFKLVDVTFLAKRLWVQLAVQTSTAAATNSSAKSSAVVMPVTEYLHELGSRRMPTSDVESSERSFDHCLVVTVQ